MGVSKLTALIIGTNYPENIEVNCITGTNGKLSGLIYLMRDGQIHSLQISTDHVFETGEEAKNKMHEICKELVEYVNNPPENES